MVIEEGCRTPADGHRSSPQHMLNNLPKSLQRGLTTIWEVLDWELDSDEKQTACKSVRQSSRVVLDSRYSSTSRLHKWRMQHPDAHEHSDIRRQGNSRVDFTRLGRTAEKRSTNGRYYDNAWVVTKKNEYLNQSILNPSHIVPDMHFL